jgi:AAA ATPase domain/AAA domain, putative AbiEii toxin, Type IV TA system
MLLNRVAIKNYRSIKELEIKFDPKCRILVGINESGKTNILDALSLLDPQKATVQRDLREPGLREDPITEAHVRFIFTFTEDETSQLIGKVKTKILSNSYLSPIVRLDGTDYTVDQFCESREGLYVANVLTKTKRASVWSLGKAQIINKWKKVGPACPPDFTVPSGVSGPIALKNFAIVDASEFPTIPAEYLEEATADDLRAPVSSFITQKVDSDLLKVLFWNYDERNLLPPKVNLDQFCANPDTCLPLKRMFQLHKISDIKEAVTSARSASANALNNLLRRVAERTSKHFHDTWREYEGIKFSLAMNGPDLVAGIADESNHYELSQRSDGFKRFVTFLLMVSAEQESDLLRDTLLLIDEPEIGLHPTGARYLMEELIDISRNNYVVFSTHSIFMIDNKIINRHLIIKKKNEITEAEEVSESNIQDEEVIYKSLGYSIFSNLKEKNLIFEGWRDKKLFEVALSRVPAAHEPIKGLKSVGHCFVRGVKQVESVTPLFEAGSRKCLILSDSDATAREHQKKFHQDRGYGVWKRYDEILAGCTAITGEDFIKETAFETLIQELAKKYKIAVLPTADLNSAGGKINALRRWLTGAGVARGEADAAMEYIKDAVFDELRNSDIKTDYYDYLDNIVPLVAAI